MKKFFVSSILLLVAARLPAATYYVATNGNDSAAGNSNAPFATPQKAVSVMVAGDTTFVHGGNYTLSSQIKPSVHGTPENYCKLWAFPGDKPVFNMTGVTARGIELARSFRQYGFFVIARHDDLQF